MKNKPQPQNPCFLRGQNFLKDKKVHARTFMKYTEIKSAVSENNLKNFIIWYIGKISPAHKTLFFRDQNLLEEIEKGSSK